jgi:hypothetical protein
MILGRAERLSAGAGTARRSRLAVCRTLYRRCWIGLVAALALACCHDAVAAENRVILLRGYLGLFSNGLDELADELKAKGFDVEVRQHLYWTDVVNDLLRDRAAGKIGTLTFVGHSQGGNDAIEIATALQVSHVPVDLIVTLTPVYPKPVPANVTRAIDYYQAGGWGSPLTPGQGLPRRAREPRPRERSEHLPLQHRGESAHPRRGRARDRSGAAARGRAGAEAATAGAQAAGGAVMVA